MPCASPSIIAVKNRRRNGPASLKDSLFSGLRKVHTSDACYQHLYGTRPPEKPRCGALEATHAPHSG